MQSYSRFMGRWKLKWYAQAPAATYNFLRLTRLAMAGGGETHAQNANNSPIGRPGGPAGQESKPKHDPLEVDDHS